MQSASVACPTRTAAARGAATKATPEEELSPEDWLPDEFVRQFHGIARPAKRKLEAINAAVWLEDLKVPPANRLEKLKSKLKDFYSIRINDQWRVIFRWVDNDAHEVRIVDYH